MASPISGAAVGAPPVEQRAQEDDHRARGHGGGPEALPDDRREGWGVTGLPVRIVVGGEVDQAEEREDHLVVPGVGPGDDVGGAVLRREIVDRPDRVHAHRGTRAGDPVEGVVGVEGLRGLAGPDPDRLAGREEIAGLEELVAEGEDPRVRDEIREHVCPWPPGCRSARCGSPRSRSGRAPGRDGVRARPGAPRARPGPGARGSPRKPSERIASNLGRDGGTRSRVRGHDFSGAVRCPRSIARTLARSSTRNSSIGSWAPGRSRIRRIVGAPTWT